MTRRSQRGFGHERREREGLATLAVERAEAVAADGGEQSVAVAEVLAAMRELPPAQRAALA